MKRIDNFLRATTATLLLSANGNPAFAGSSTLNYTNPGSGVQMRMTTDSSGFYLNNMAIFDSAAGANGLKIDSNGLIGINNATVTVSGTVATTQSGTFTATQNATWTVNSIQSGTYTTLSVQSGTWTFTPNGTLTTSSVQNGTWTFNCASGCGGSGGTSAADNSTFTGGSTSVTPVGGVVGASTVTSGHMGAIGMDSGRNAFVNMTEMANQTISSSCVSTLSGLTTSIPSSVCAVYGTYVLNATAVGPAAASASSPVSPSNQAVGAATVTTGQITVSSTTASQVVSARTGVAGTGRVAVTICNTTTANIYIGTSAVTITTGMPLAPIVGACDTLNVTAAVYAITNTGTASVGFQETF